MGTLWIYLHEYIMEFFIWVYYGFIYVGTLWIIYMGTLRISSHEDVINLHGAL